MADYNNFRQVLQDRKGTPAKRRVFVRAYLKRTYDIDYDINPQFFDELTRPHDHDNQPLHYGQVPHTASFGFAVSELVRDAKGQWRIAVTFDPEGSERHVLQANDEASDENRDARLRFITLISDSVPEEEDVMMLPPAVANGMTFKRGGGKYGDISVLYSATREEGDSISLTHPAHIPAWLQVPEADLPGQKVDLSRYLEPSA